MVNGECGKKHVMVDGYGIILFLLVLFDVPSGHLHSLVAVGTGDGDSTGAGVKIGCSIGDT